MFTLLHRRTPLRSPAFSPDGMKLAAAQARGGVVVWDLASREAECRLVTGRYALGVLYPAVDQLFVHTWAALWHFDGPVTVPQVVPRPDGYEYHAVRGAAMAAGGSRLYLALSSSVHALPLPQPAAPAWSWGPEHRSDVWSLALAADGKTLAVGMDLGRVALLDAATGAELETWKVSRSRAAAVALSPGGKAVAWCAGSRLRLARRDCPDFIERSLGKTHFLGVAWHPSGAFFATVNGDGKADFWDAGTAERRESFDWGLGKLNGIAFDATGGRAAACSERGEIVVWDIDV